MTTTATTGLAVGQRVSVHYNLQRGDFSVAHAPGAKIICNVDSITLEGCVMRVGEKKRQTTIAMKKRKVMAYVIGTIVDVNEPYQTDSLRKLTYNPFRCGAFHYPDNGAEVWSNPLVHFADAYCWT